MTKKQNKKSQQLERRAKEKERLLAIYKEGESNIDHEKLKDKSWEEVFELMEAGTIPIKTKEQWLKEELDKWEENQIEVPSYKVQDPQAQLVKFQQRFVDEAKNVKPEAFEKLRAFAPSFQYLFTKETGKDFTMQLYELRETLISHVLSSAYWQPNEKITPDNVWRVFLKPTFVLARTMTHIDTPALNIEYDDMVKSQIEFHRYSLENFNQQIAYQFKDSAYDEDIMLIHFFHRYL
jgi:hypothetical protein